MVEFRSIQLVKSEYTPPVKSRNVLLSHEILSWYKYWINVEDVIYSRDITLIDNNINYDDKSLPTYDLMIKALYLDKDIPRDGYIQVKSDDPLMIEALCWKTCIDTPWNYGRKYLKYDCSLFVEYIFMLVRYNFIHVATLMINLWRELLGTYCDQGLLFNKWTSPIIKFYGNRATSSNNVIITGTIYNQNIWIKQDHKYMNLSTMEKYNTIPNGIGLNYIYDCNEPCLYNGDRHTKLLDIRNMEVRSILNQYEQALYTLENMHVSNIEQTLREAIKYTYINTLPISIKTYIKLGDIPISSCETSNSTIITNDRCAYNEYDTKMNNLLNSCKYDLNILRQYNSPLRDIYNIPAIIPIRSSCCYINMVVHVIREQVLQEYLSMNYTELSYDILMKILMSISDNYIFNLACLASILNCPHITSYIISVWGYILNIDISKKYHETHSLYGLPDVVDRIANGYDKTKRQILVEDKAGHVEAYLYTPAFSLRLYHGGKIEGKTYISHMYNIYKEPISDIPVKHIQLYSYWNIHDINIISTFVYICIILILIYILYSIISYKISNDYLCECRYIY